MSEVASSASVVISASKLDNALTDLINKSVAATGDALAWAKGQIPEVVEQLLTWHFVQSMILFFTGAVVFAVVLFVAKKLWNACDSDGDRFAVMLFSVFISMFPITFMAVNLDWLKIWIAPKVWLIEYAANLIK